MSEENTNRVRVTIERKPCPFCNGQRSYRETNRCHLCGNVACDQCYQLHYEKCPSCGQVVCEQCYNSGKKMCERCVDSELKEAALREKKEQRAAAFKKMKRYLAYGVSSVLLILGIYMFLYFYPAIMDADIVVGRWGYAHHDTITGAVNASGPGTRIYVRPGTYRESLFIQKDITIDGGFLFMDSEIVSNGKPVLTAATSSFNANNMHFCFTGTDSTESPGGVVIASGNTVFNECTFSSANGNAVTVSSFPGKSNFSACAFESSRVGLHVSDGSMVVITQCDFKECVSAGIMVASGSEVIIRDSSCDACGTGMYVGPEAKAEMVSLHTEDSKRYGIYVKGNAELKDCSSLNDSTGLCADGQSVVRMSKLAVHLSEKDGILFRGDSSSIVSYSEINENRGNGLRYIENADGEIKECKISENNNGIYFAGNSILLINTTSVISNGDKGIIGKGEGSLQLKACKVHGNDGSGVALYENSSLQASNCKMYDNALFGLYVKSQGESSIVNSMLSNNKTGGVRVKLGHVVLEKTEVKGNGEAGIHASGQSVVKVKDLKVHHNKLFGVNVDENGSMRASEIQLYDNVLGMYACGGSLEASDVSVYNNTVCGMVVTEKSMVDCNTLDIHKNGYAGIVGYGSDGARLNCVNTTLKNNGYIFKEKKKRKKEGNEDEKVFVPDNAVAKKVLALVDEKKRNGGIG